MSAKQREEGKKGDARKLYKMIVHEGGREERNRKDKIKRSRHHKS